MNIPNDSTPGYINKLVLGAVKEQYASDIHALSELLELRFHCSKVLSIDQIEGRMYHAGSCPLISISLGVDTPEQLKILKSLRNDMPIEHISNPIIAMVYANIIELRGFSQQQELYYAKINDPLSSYYLQNRSVLMDFKKNITSKKFNFQTNNSPINTAFIQKFDIDNGLVYIASEEFIKYTQRVAEQKPEVSSFRHITMNSGIHSR